MKILVMSHFLAIEMGILIVDRNNINLDGINFDEDDPETIIHVRFMASYNKLQQHISFKKELSRQLMPVPWHPKRRWENEKNINITIF